MGSGKTTLANKLSKKLNINHYELDDIYWKRKYDLKRTNLECEKRLEKISKKKKWIIEGVYSKWIEPGIKESDMVVWLDPPFFKLVYRIIFRKLKRRKRKGFVDKWDDVFLMIKNNYGYVNAKHDNAEDNWGSKTRTQQRELIHKHKIKHVFLKNNKEIKDFLKAI